MKKKRKGKGNPEARREYLYPKNLCKQKYASPAFAEIT
jgi:hypothetical protein